jgi:hypothetical protein
MLLKKILEKIEYEQLYGVADKDITGISIEIFPEAACL